MTAKQITKKLAAKLSVLELSQLEITRDEVEVMVPDEHDKERCDSDKSHALATRIADILGFGSLRSRGHGGWGVFNTPAEDMGDWNDPSSRWHY